MGRKVKSACFGWVWRMSANTQRNYPLRSSLFLDVTQRKLVVTEVSWQPVGPIFGYKAIKRVLLLLFSNDALQTLRLIVRSGLDVPTFATRPLHACHHTRAPSGGRWKCPWILPTWRLPRYIYGFLHAVKLRHGTDGFTFPPKEGMLRIFSP